MTSVKSRRSSSNSRNSKLSTWVLSVYSRAAGVSLLPKLREATGLRRQLRRQLSALLGAYRFDVVTIRIEQVRRVILRTIVSAHARRPIVSATGLEPVLVEAVDHGPVGRT